MAFVYLSGGYMIKVSGTRGQIANLLSDRPPEDPYVELETEAFGTSPAVAVTVNASQIVAITDQPVPSKV